MGYKIDDTVEFIRLGDIVAKGTIVDVKGRWFKRYRIIYNHGLFNTLCEWIRAKNIIRLVKEG